MFEEGWTVHLLHVRAGVATIDVDGRTIAVPDHGLLAVVSPRDLQL